MTVQKPVVKRENQHQIEMALKGREEDILHHERTLIMDV